ncbi:MAG: hypothetical protein NTY09_09420 [bacterium]|nr:hypothetical protein [bacterium]
MPVEKSVESRRQNPMLQVLTCIIVLVMLMTGCGKKGGVNPALPGVDSDNPAPESQSLTAASDFDYPDSVPGAHGGKAMWGYWDISWTEENGFEVIPLRGIEYTFNINTFIQPPVNPLSTFQIKMIDMEKLLLTGEVEVELSIKHPFPNMEQFTAFDLIGVIYGTGTYIAGSNTDIIYANPAVDPVLKNADGYTRWFNQSEFPKEGIVGYTEGAMGNQDQTWGSTINPYKYFAHGIYPTQSVTNYYQSAAAVANRGAFRTTDIPSRDYKLDFPIVNGHLDVRFQYAFIVSWVEPAHTPPMSIPDDFPAEANMQEAFACDISTAGSTLYWNDMHDSGGNLVLTLEVFDWQLMSGSGGLVGQISKVVLDSPDEFINGGNALTFYPGTWTEYAGTDPNSVKLVLNVDRVQPQGPCPYDNDVLITIVTGEMGDYSNGLSFPYPHNGVLSGYARLFYDMGNICNDPPILEFVNCPENGTFDVKNITILWQGEDDITPNKLLDYRYKLDAEPWSDWQTDKTQTNLENLSETNHIFQVECRDYDGQITHAQCQFLVHVPPLSNPPKVSFSNCTQYIHISDDTTPISQMKVRCSLDAGIWVEKPVGTTALDYYGLDPDMYHEIIVEVEDKDGYKNQAVCDFSVNFNPTVVIDNCPSQDHNSTTITFQWSGGDPDMDVLNYETKLDTEPWIDRGGSTQLIINGLSSGNHVFYVRVTDGVDGSSQAQCNFRVNLPPTVNITNCPVSDLHAFSYTFNWNASDDMDSAITLEYNIELDGFWQGWVNGISSYLWSPMTSGSHNFSVRVRDSGNPQQWVEDTCSFDVNMAPNIVITNCPANIVMADNYTFNWTGSDDIDGPGSLSYSWRIDGLAWSAWQIGLLSINVGGLTDTTHVFEVAVQDTGIPPLTCHGPPDVCAVCNFAVNVSAAILPGDVPNFQASDGDLTIPEYRKVLLTWNTPTGVVDWYDIDHYNYTAGTGWAWDPLVSVPGGTLQYYDTNARYSGPVDPINYRIKARNTSGSSVNFGTDTGYPRPREVYLAFWCALDGSGNQATTWARAAADFNDTNEFWNQYGIKFELVQNSFNWVTNTAYWNISGGGEAVLMHADYGWNFPKAINVYYVNQTSPGQTWGAFCMVECPGSWHNTQNVCIVDGSATRGTPPNEYEIVLAHELGHGMARFWDEYLLDQLGNGNYTGGDDGTSCAADDTWCTVPPNTPWLFCDDTATYNGQLMWYSFAAPISSFDIMDTQWDWLDWWIRNYEGNYPYP